MNKKLTKDEKLIYAIFGEDEDEDMRPSIERARKALGPEVEKKIQEALAKASKKNEV